MPALILFGLALVANWQHMGAMTLILIPAALIVGWVDRGVSHDE